MRESQDAGDIDDEYRFVLWVEDPSGSLHCVEGVKSFGVAGAAILWAQGAGRLLRGVLGVVNQGLVRAQRPRSYEGCHLEVFRVVGDQHQLVFDDDLDDWRAGRRRAERLVEEIRAGAFVAQDVDG